MDKAAAFCPAYLTGIFTIEKGDAAGAGDTPCRVSHAPTNHSKSSANDARRTPVVGLRTAVAPSLRHGLAAV